MSTIFPLRSDYLLFLILCVPAICYYSYAIYATSHFFRGSVDRSTHFQPAVTILKPLCGLDLNSYENFASFCHQDYPDYQIVFGVLDSADPCIQVVNQIIQDFPDIDIQLVVSDRIIGSNLKVSNLANAATQAKHSLLILADSDVRVGPDYIQRLVRPFENPEVGVVSCLFRSIAHNWVARFEALGITTEFLAGVLVANQLGGIQFGLGPTLMIRRHVLQEIGGFEAIADYLADDYQLGYLPTQVGYRTELSDYVIDHCIATENFADLLHRQVRWACCARVSRFWGYVGLFLTHGILTSLLFLMMTGGSALGWLGLGLTWSTRLTMAWLLALKLQDRAAQRFFWLVPIRDMISFGIWCYSLRGDRIQWRGRQMRLTTEGKLVAV